MSSLSQFLKQNPEAQSYFQALPAVVQENLQQAGVSVQSLEELSSIADKMLR